MKNKIEDFLDKNSSYEDYVSFAINNNLLFFYERDWSYKGPQDFRVYIIQDNYIYFGCFEIQSFYMAHSLEMEASWVQTFKEGTKKEKKSLIKKIYIGEMYNEK